ncbi:hypothetical protein WJX84_004468 [Apatococcus fuscideae]|uniref:DUF1206 domain-containing protein n=1 Tax=Apatococcus fuscideae TaxID=2026836 RepID=A0AAW1TC15_9CHLO
MFGFINRTLKVSQRQETLLVICGRVGWLAKAIVYAIIGGICCDSAVKGHSSKSGSASPQGAFIWIGDDFFGVPLLIVMAIMLCLYSLWRFGEAIVGSGTDSEISTGKNFFRYRLSPFVSGGVYSAYAAYVISLLGKNRKERLEAQYGHGFPDSWRSSAGGKFGLIVIGVAFLAATASQLENTVSPGWHRELESDLHPVALWATLISGHIGFAARSGTFLLVAILFFRTIFTDTGSETTVANAMYQLQNGAGHRFILFFLGIGLVVYGLFAALCAVHSRAFPTKPRSDSSSLHSSLPETRAPTFGGAMGAEWLRKQMSKPASSMQMVDITAMSHSHGHSHGGANPARNLDRERLLPGDSSTSSAPA